MASAPSDLPPDGAADRDASSASSWSGSSTTSTGSSSSTTASSTSSADDDDLYGQRSMAETVFSSVKRSLGSALRARSWYREFREVALMCAVYNIKKAAKQEIPIPSCD